MCFFLASSFGRSIRVFSKEPENGMIIAPGSFLSTYSLILGSLKRKRKRKWRMRNEIN
jgi:hypothetical protein